MVPLRQYLVHTMALKAHSAFYLVRKQSLLFDRRKSFRCCLARSQEILLLCFLVFYIFHSAHPTGWAKSIWEDIPKKSSCSFGFCPNEGEGGGSCPIFLSPFDKWLIKGVYFLQNANNLNFKLFFWLYS